MTDHVYQITRGALSHSVNDLLKFSGVSSSLAVFEDSLNPELRAVIRAADEITGTRDPAAAEPAKAGEAHALLSLFNMLNGNQANGVYRCEPIENQFFCPVPGDKAESVDIHSAAQRFASAIKHLQLSPDSIDLFLQVMETELSTLPYNWKTGMRTDISLYDHAKISAAVASSLLLYINENNTINGGSTSDLRELYRSKTFQMASCDISGIQPFIYNIAIEGALKSLRARSFYLELMIEQVLDEFLKAVGLSRTNLIYTGGGHAYLLMPNTRTARDAWSETFHSLNHWLFDRFSTALFVAADCVECSANDLMNLPAEQSPLQVVFAQLAGKLSDQKLKRYNADEIRVLNNRLAPDTSTRECRICGSVHKIVPDKGRFLCETCDGLQAISSSLARKNAMFLVADCKLTDPAMPLPGVGGGERYLHVTDAAHMTSLLNGREHSLLRVYGKNAIPDGFPHACKLRIGDYTATNGDEVFTFQQFGECAHGIKRVGVLRADVDNLGRTFTSGFEQSGVQATLARTASLSHALSLFFKHFINDLLANGPKEGGRFSLTGEPSKNARRVTIVYSGGDDVFLVGPWDEVIEAAVDLRRAFAEFSENALHLSAGVGLFEPKYPLSLMAQETAQLEDFAKHFNGRRKNAIALFGMQYDEKSNGVICSHTYSWQDFEEKVVGEKLRVLQKYSRNDRDGLGTTAVYKMYDTLSGVEDDQINIARFAYQLGRLSPGDKAGAQEAQMYSVFCSSMYRWALEETNRKQLLTAMQLYLYLKREKEIVREEN